MGVCSGGGGCRLVGTRRNEGMVTLKLPFNTLVQKGVIALAGLLWVGFLLFHLAGNWLLLDTPGKYNRLAATLTGWGWLFHAVEILLLAALVVHGALAMAIARSQRRFHRPHHRRWLVSWTSRWMVVTGPLVLVFLAVHLQNFRLQPNRDLEFLVKHQFQSPVWLGFYELALIPLGLHLAHGIGSSLQSLGVGHPRWTPHLPTWSAALSLLLMAGYALIPLALYLQSR
ncbi:MAG: hypothetical protein Q6K26_07555 [Gloeomargarita sp. SZTDM-1c_bins_89]